MNHRAPSRASALLLLLVVIAAGAAWGYWGGSGSGEDTAPSGTPAALLVLTAATPTSAVHPGGQASVAVTVSNPNSADVRLASLVLDTTKGVGGFTVDPGHAGCSTTSLSFAAQSNGGSGWTVPGSSFSSLDLPGALSMSTGAADACQGASFTVHLRAGP